MRIRVKDGLSRVLLGGVLLLTISGSGALMAQEGGPPSAADGSPGRSGPPFGRRRPPLQRALHVGPPGRWWDNPDFAKKIGLTPEQQKKMDDVFLQNRLKLIDLSASVQKQEAEMDPLLRADQLDQKQVLARIDQLAETRASLEKANARMLLELRSVLTPAQWKQLQAEEPTGERGQRGERLGRPGPPSGGEHEFHPD